MIWGYNKFENKWPYFGIFSFTRNSPNAKERKEKLILGLAWQKCIPRTLFPTLSSGGDQHMTPMTLGITSSIAPDTPDLAGKPTLEMRARGWMWYLFQVNKWKSISFTV